MDPRLGNHGDLVEFIRTAKDRGIRVIADLVVNHTSDRHPWFQAARRSRGQPATATTTSGGGPAAGHPEQVVFPGEETSIWELGQAHG